MEYLPMRSTLYPPSAQVTLTAMREGISSPLASTRVRGRTQWLSWSQRRKEAAAARAEQKAFMRQSFSCTFSYRSMSSQEWQQEVRCGMRMLLVSASSASNTSRWRCFLPQQTSTITAAPSRLPTLSVKLCSMLWWRGGALYHSSTRSAMACLARATCSGHSSSSSTLSSAASCWWICLRSASSARQSVRHSWERMRWASSRAISSSRFARLRTTRTSRGSTTGSQSLRWRLRCQTDRLRELDSASLARKTGRRRTDTSGLRSPHSYTTSTSSTRTNTAVADCAATLPCSSGWLNSACTNATGSNLFARKNFCILRISQTRKSISWLLSLSLKVVTQRSRAPGVHLTMPWFSASEMHSPLSQKSVSLQEKRPATSSSARRLTPRLSSRVTLTSRRTYPTRPCSARARPAPPPPPSARPPADYPLSLSARSLSARCFSARSSSLAILLLRMLLTTSLRTRLPSPLTTSQMMVWRSTSALMESTARVSSVGVKARTREGMSTMLNRMMPLRSAVTEGCGSLRFFQVSRVSSPNRLRYSRISPSRWERTRLILNSSRNLLMLSARLLWLLMLARRSSSSSRGSGRGAGLWERRERARSWQSEKMAMTLEKVLKRRTWQLSLAISSEATFDCSDSYRPRRVAFEITCSPFTCSSAPASPSAASVLNSLQVMRASRPLRASAASGASASRKASTWTARVMRTLLLRLTSWISSRVVMSSLQSCWQYFSHWKAVLTSWMQSFSFRNSVFIAFSPPAYTMFTSFYTYSLNTMKKRPPTDRRYTRVRVRLMRCSGKFGRSSEKKTSSESCNLARSLPRILLRKKLPSSSSSVEWSAMARASQQRGSCPLCSWQAILIRFCGERTCRFFSEMEICQQEALSLRLCMRMRHPLSSSSSTSSKCTKKGLDRLKSKKETPSSLVPTNRPQSTAITPPSSSSRKIGKDRSNESDRLGEQRKSIMMRVMAMLQLSCSARQLRREGLRRMGDSHPKMLQSTSSLSWYSFLSSRTCRAVTSFLVRTVSTLRREWTVSKWSRLVSTPPAIRMAFLTSKPMRISPDRSMRTLRARPSTPISATVFSCASQMARFILQILTSMSTSLKISMPSMASSFSFLSRSSCIIFLLFSELRTSVIFFISLSKRTLLMTSSLMLSSTDTGTSPRMPSSPACSALVSFSSLASLATSARQAFCLFSSKLQPLRPFLMMLRPQSQKCCTQWNTWLSCRLFILTSMLLMSTFTSTTYRMSAANRWDPTALSRMVVRLLMEQVGYGSISLGWGFLGETGEWLGKGCAIMRMRKCLGLWAWLVMKIVSASLKQSWSLSMLRSFLKGRFCSLREKWRVQKERCSFSSTVQLVMPSMITPKEQSQLRWQLSSRTWMLFTLTTALSTMRMRFFSAKVSSFPPSLHFFFISMRMRSTMLLRSSAGSVESSTSWQLMLRRTQMPWTLTEVHFSLRLVQGMLMCIFSMWLNLSVKGRPSSLTKELLRETFSMVTSPSSRPMSRLFFSPSTYFPRCVTSTLSMIFFIKSMQAHPSATFIPLIPHPNPIHTPSYPILPHPYPIHTLFYPHHPYRQCCRQCILPFDKQHAHHALPPSRSPQAASHSLLLTPDHQHPSSALAFQRAGRLCSLGEGQLRAVSLGGAPEEQRARVHREDAEGEGRGQRQLSAAQERAGGAQTQNLRVIEALTAFARAGGQDQEENLNHRKTRNPKGQTDIQATPRQTATAETISNLRKTTQAQVIRCSHEV